MSRHLFDLDLFLARLALLTGYFAAAKPGKYPFVSSGNHSVKTASYNVRACSVLILKQLSYCDRVLFLHHV